MTNALLNLSSKSVCAKMTGDSPPAAPSAGMWSVQLQGWLLLFMLLQYGDSPQTNPHWALLPDIQLRFLISGWKQI